MEPARREGRFYEFGPVLLDRIHKEREAIKLKGE